MKYTVDFKLKGKRYVFYSSDPLIVGNIVGYLESELSVNAEVTSYLYEVDIGEDIRVYDVNNFHQFIDLIGSIT